MRMPIDKEWFEKRAAAEGDLEIGAGRLTMTINLSPEEMQQLEQLALQSLPQWATDENCQASRDQRFARAIATRPAIGAQRYDTA